MKIENASTAEGLPADGRRARLVAMMEKGRITPEQAALIDFRDPPAHVLEHGKQLASKLKSRAEISPIPPA